MITLAQLAALQRGELGAIATVRNIPNDDSGLVQAYMVIQELTKELGIYWKALDDLRRWVHTRVPVINYSDGCEEHLAFRRAYLKAFELTDSPGPCSGTPNVECRGDDA